MGYRLGIDLGTTFTAAAVEEGGRAEVIQLGDHAPQIPSAVFVREDGELLVGEAAARRGAVQPDRFEREFKRRLGDRTPFLLGGQEFTAEQLMAELLRTVVSEVQRRQGRPAERIALTHPANWGAHRRAVLLEAVRLAGVGGVTTLTEPAAAAVHYSSTERADVGDVVAVYDLGGGTFDAAVLRKTATEFELLGTPDGVEQLGGVDFDDMVFRHVLRSLDGMAAGLDPEEAAVVAALVRLRRECTEAKEALSADSETTVPVALPGVAPTAVRLTRAEFEDMIRPDVDRTVHCMRRALDSASVQPDDIRTVVLVGGSSRMPLVAESLGSALGRPVTPSTQPKLAVALGAALLAGGVIPAGPPAPGEAASGRAGAPPGREQARSPRGGGSTPGTRPGRPATAPGGRDTDRPPAPGRPTAARTGVARLAAALSGLVGLAVLVAFAAPLLTDPRPPPGVTIRGEPAEADMHLDLAGQLPVHKDTSTTVAATVLGLPWPSTQSTEGIRLRAADFLGGPVRLVFKGTQEGVVVVSHPTRGLAGAVKVAPVLLTLFAAAYTESLLRKVRRRGRPRRLDLVAMGGVGAVAGLALVLASWAVRGNDVVLPVLVAVLVLMAAAGALAPLLQAAARRRPAAPARASARSRPPG